MRGRALTLVAVLLLVGLAACGDDEDDGGVGTATTEPGQSTTTAAPGGAATVSIKTVEYGYEAPARFVGGLVRIELDNSQGKESHEADLIRLEPGKTLADVRDAIRPSAPPPPGSQPAGGPGPVLPGKKATYTANLEPGNYVLMCHVPAPDGKEHLEKGMVAPATVTEGTPGTVPQGDVTVGAKDYDFTGTEGLKAGTQTVRVENQGALLHHWAVIAMAPGKGPRDLGAFFAAVESGSPPSGPPPFTGFPGLVSTLPPGGSAARTLELQSGTTYVFACFIPDPDGKTHAEKGMLKPVTIT